GAGETGPCRGDLPLRHSHPGNPRGYARIRLTGAGMKHEAAFSRRDILRSGSALVISFAFLRQETKAQARSGFAGKPVDGTEVDSFLVIHPDSRVTVFTGKVDLG